MDNAQTLEQKVDRILFYLESDSRTNQEGLIEKVNRIDKVQSEYKAKLSVLTVVLTIVFNIAFWLANKFIK